MDGELVEGAETERVVSDYVSTGVTVSTEKVWDHPETAPGNEKTKLHSAKLRSLDSRDSKEITVATAIEIEFEFWNYQPLAVLNLTMHLFTIEGAYVFAAGTAGKPRPLGLMSGTAGKLA